MPQEGDDKVDLCGRGSWWLGTLKDTPNPGFYHIRGFIEEGELNPHINTSPCDYNVTAKPVEKIPCKHVMFRSTVQRISFPPKNKKEADQLIEGVACSRVLDSLIKNRRRDLLRATIIHRPDQRKASVPASNPHCPGFTMSAQRPRDQAPTNLAGSWATDSKQRP
ncbi:protein STPG4 isoform X4 [Larimichthys crocea]|uniref:protein STPG4 isoform X4 n=1 Tax=Larimichthys crocea TaxID=215358 RepID=UPI000F5F3DE8|nr:protein STPG4 isoform X4 [Larimichthys crocea]